MVQGHDQDQPINNNYKLSFPTPFNGFHLHLHPQWTQYKNCDQWTQAYLNKSSTLFTNNCPKSFEI